MREAAAMALQLIGERDIAAFRDIVAAWMPDPSFLTMRAIVAGLAHPPMLADPDVALFSVDTARPIVAALSRADAKARGSESFKVLRQGLGYALSVFAAHSPGDGFALLRRSAAVRDPDVAWVIRENLKKKRIAEAFPRECEQVAAILEETNPR
jgi:hypothetical protein